MAMEYWFSQRNATFFMHNVKSVTLPAEINQNKLSKNEFKIIY